MIIGITGYGCTGASAVIDLIQEFDSIQSYPSSVEFQIMQQPDGILDLHYHVVVSGRRLANNVAIKRFIRNIGGPGTSQIRRFTNGQYEKLSQEYIQKLIQIHWMGKSAFDPQDVRFFLDRLSLKMLNKVIAKGLGMLSRKKLVWLPMRDRYFSIVSEDEFAAVTREYIREILKASGFDLNQAIILEQLFNTSDPLAGADYVDDPVSIIVDRDPRDVFLLMNHYYPKNITSFMPNNGDVDQFINYYKRLHREKSKDPRVLYVQFEDLIYRYDEVCGQVANLLKGHQHVRKGELFKPECSINNTMVYKKYPQFSEQIRRIEEALPEYLYPFEEMQKRVTFEVEDVGIFNRQVDVDKKLKK